MSKTKKVEAGAGRQARSSIGPDDYALAQPVRNCRGDWSEFFRSCQIPHGLRLTLTPFEAMSKEARRTEVRLVSLIRRQALKGALCPAAGLCTGPARLECIFSIEGDVDAIGTILGAKEHPQRRA